MNIREFKPEDIITRNAPVKYNHNDHEDGSYCGDRLIFKGHDEASKTIFFHEEICDGLIGLSYARDRWDEGWCYYPETLWQKINKFIKKI